MENCLLRGIVLQGGAGSFVLVIEVLLLWSIPGTTSLGYLDEHCRAGLLGSHLLRRLGNSRAEVRDKLGRPTRCSEGALAGLQGQQ